MRWKSECLCIAFGALIIFEIFGDQFFFKGVGNLDSLFGINNRIYYVMDVLYPLASIVVFLLYGRSKGSLVIKSRSIWYIIIFVAALVVIQIDDFFVVLFHRITLPDSYWIAARLFYLFAAPSTFLLYGSEYKKARDFKQREVD